MTSAETPPTAPAAPPAPKAYRSQAGHYDRRTDASSSGVNCSSRRCLSGPGIPSVAADCGTGLYAPLLHRQVGPTGTIIGIDESEQMLAVAAHRVTEHGWDNVRLIATPVATAPI